MPRVEIPFAGSSKPHRSSFIADQICRNWYTEIVRDDGGKEAFRVLIGTPGKILLANVSGSPTRALHMSSSLFPKYWAVFGNKFYEFNNANAPTLIGTLKTQEGPVYIADNGTHLLMVDGSNTGYVYDIRAGVWTDDLASVAPNFIGGDHIIFISGYFFVIQPGTNILQSCTAPYGTSPVTWNAADAYSTALTDAGPVIALGSTSGLLFAIGDYSTNIFQNTGNPTGFPFTQLTGNDISIGISSRASLKELNGSLIWPAKTKKGEKFIVRTEGLYPKRISTHEIESAIGKYSSVADSHADAYMEEGHSFYMLTYPTGNQTWVWDEATREWHERASYGVGRDRAYGHIYFLGKHIVGDSTTGNIYQSSLDVFVENNQPLVSTRRCQHLKQARNPLEIPALIIDAEVGVGLAGDVQGSDPQMSLKYSRDSGKTWSNELTSSMGKIGDYRALIRYPRLGTAEDWVFEIQVSDPVRRNIMAAYVET